MDKERWIDEVIGSTKGMADAQPRAGLYENIMQGINKPDAAKPAGIPVRQWAAAALLLLSLNAGSVLYYTHRNKETATLAPVNPIAQELQSESTYNY